MLLELSKECMSQFLYIIALPQNQNDTEVSVSWERGEEILPGALAAIEEAKNDSLSFNLSSSYGYQWSSN